MLGRDFDRGQIELIIHLDYHSNLGERRRRFTLGWSSGGGDSSQILCFKVRTNSFC